MNLQNRDKTINESGAKKTVKKNQLGEFLKEKVVVCEELLCDDEYIITLWSGNQVKITFKSKNFTETEICNLIDGEIITKSTKSNMVSNNQYYII